MLTRRYTVPGFGLAAVALWLCFASVESLPADESQWSLASAPEPSSTTSKSTREQGQGGSVPLRNVASSLAIVFGVFMLVSTLLRRPKMPKHTSALLESLGAVQLTPRVQLHVVRCGSRLLVLHVAQDTVEKIAEISEPGLGAEGSEIDSLPDHPQVDELLRQAESDARRRSVA